jgi:hypothetical protein
MACWKIISEGKILGMVPLIEKTQDLEKPLFCSDSVFATVASRLELIAPKLARRVEG